MKNSQNFSASKARSLAGILMQWRETKRYQIEISARDFSTSYIQTWLRPLKICSRLRKCYETYVPAHLFNTLEDLSTLFSNYLIA